MPSPNATFIARRTRHVTKKGRTGPFVKYVGSAAKRTISGAAWRSLGIDLKDRDVTHLWSAANNYLIESSAFSEAQLDYLLVDEVGPNGAHTFIEVNHDEDHDLVQTIR